MPVDPFSSHLDCTYSWNLPSQITQTPKLIDLTERTATLSWTTDEPSDAFIEYGTDSLDIQKASPDFVTQHQITLTNLISETTYQYQISATDEPGNEAAPSAIFTFTTEATPSPNRPHSSAP
jgi:chitodextrinase